MLPSLIHRVWTEIQPIAKADTFFDTDAREPIRVAARGTTVGIWAQHQPSPEKAFEVYPQGVAENVRGYILLREVDMTAASYTPKRGDRIVKIGKRTTALYVVGVQDCGHYEDQNGASLVRLFYADRRPGDSQPSRG